MKKLGIAGIIVLLVIMMVASVKITRLERSPLCDQYQVSVNEPLQIPNACIKSGK